MMDNNLLFKISLSISLLGILLLSVYGEALELKIRSISEITRQDIDKLVKIAGQVTNSKDLPGIHLLDLKDKAGEITVIIFKEEKLEINKNDFLEIEGFVKEYQGKLEIQAEKITKA